MCSCALSPSPLPRRYSLGFGIGTPSCLQNDEATQLTGVLGDLLFSKQPRHEEKGPLNFSLPWGQQTVEEPSPTQKRKKKAKKKLAAKSEKYWKALAGDPMELVAAHQKRALEDADHVEEMEQTAADILEEEEVEEEKKQVLLPYSAGASTVW